MINDSYFWCGDKNIARHTMLITVSWLNPDQWLVIHTPYLFDAANNIKYTRELNKLKTHSLIKTNSKNWLNGSYTIDRIYLTNILYVQRLKISLHHDDNDMKEYANKGLCP